ncbi:MAG: hypothetical protein H7Z72_19285 [Bacteroidetes bacterium]|nr:hypothetical protein [Fibrella sp.]
METTLFRQDPDSWLSSDIAIEVIGRMVAEQMSLLYALLNEYRDAGIESDDERVVNDVRHQQYQQQIAVYRNEIKSIYRGENKAEIFDRVEYEYAPYIKQKYAPSARVTQR